MMSWVFERIVLAYDGSEPADHAVKLAFEIAHACDAEVVAVHAITLPQGLPVHADALAAFDQHLRDEDDRWWRRLEALADLAPPGTRFVPRLLQGPAAATLLEELGDGRADLVVAGTHGVGGLKPLLGSVSHQLVEDAPCPVLLVRDVVPAAGRLTVLAAVDGSQESVQGLAAAQTLAAGLGATLRLVHVVDPHIPFATEPMAGVIRELRRHGRKVLHDARASVQAPLDEVVEELREGSPRAELVAACTEHAPAMAVIGSRGVGGFRGLLLGSTARELVNHAACPVLVTRGSSTGEHA